MNNVKIAHKCVRLTSYPAIKEFKIAACSSFIIDAFLYSKNELSESEIKNYLSINYNISNIPEIIFRKSLFDLEKNNILKKKGKYIINPDAKKKLDEESKQLIEVNNEMIKCFVNTVKSFRKTLDEHEEKLIISLFIEVLNKIIDEMNIELLEFFNGSKDLRMFDKEEFLSILSELFPKIHDEQLAKIFFRSLQLCFNKPNENFSLGVFLFAQRKILCDVLGKDIEIEKFSKKVVSNIKIYLDTNVIIAALCPASIDHKPIEEILDATNKDLKIALRILDITEKEFINSYNHALDLLNDEKLGVLFIKEGFNEIIDTYRRVASHYGSFEDFVDELKAEYDNFKRTYEVNIIDTEIFEAKDYIISAIRKIIFDEFIKKGWNIKPNIEHDARAIFIIQQMRKQDEDQNKINHWFLTRHDKLMQPDASIAKTLFSSDYPSLVKIDTWIDAIFPFLTVTNEENEVEISKVYTTSIGHFLVPLISGPEINDFLKFTLSIIGVSKKDEKYYMQKALRNINRKLLDYELERGEQLNAFKIVIEALQKDKNIEMEKTLEEKDIRIEHQQLALRKRMDQVDELTTKLTLTESLATLNKGLNVTGDGNTVNVNIFSESFNSIDNSINDLTTVLLKLYPGEEIIKENLKDLETDPPEVKRTKLEKIKDWLGKHQDQFTLIAIELISKIIDSIK